MRHRLHSRIFPSLAFADPEIHVDPAAAYGIDLGDAHVIRNAGGNAKDALRSLVISEQLLGTQEIILVKHTGCGMLTFKNEDATAIVGQNLGEDAVKELAGFSGDFQPFPALEDAVKSDVEFLKTSKLIPDAVKISGWVYEVETGKVRSVV
jgi:carbonic anhydrase